MRSLLITLVVVLAACSGGDNPDADAVIGAGNDPDLAAEAAAIVQDAKVPAFAIGRISPDGTVTIGVAGTRAHDSDVALSVNAPFHLGSDTKAMTAVLLGTFVEDGDLDLDSSLGALFPDVEMEPTVAGATVRDVLGHRAGLDDSTLDLRAMHAASDASAARAAAVREALRRPGITPGSYAYANVNYMVAGELAERLGGDTWERLLIQRVLTPLGMTCGFGAPLGPTAPLGHTAAGRPIAEDAEVMDNPPALGPAGTVHCAIADWARFAVAVLTGLRGEDTPVLSATSFTALFDDDHDYVAGWARMELGGRTVYTHDGSNTFWYCRAVLVPEHNTAMLLASNTGEAGAVTAMGDLTRAFLAERPT